MKNLYPFKGLFFLFLVAFLSSCGPVVSFFNIDERIPARYPVNFEEKTISVFVSVYDDLSAEPFLFRNDSTQMSNMANSIASVVEKNLALDQGAVYVFNHFPVTDRSYDMEYIQNLAFQSNSDIVVLLDTLHVAKPQVLNGNKSNLTREFQSNYLYAPIRSVLNVYDGISADRLVRIDQTDTVYWEILSRVDVAESAMRVRAIQSMTNVSTTLGSDIADLLFPSWRPKEKYLYYYETSSWRRAVDFANEFKWREAMDIWLEYSTHPDIQKAAVAAFNLAVACELTDRPELALEWVNRSIKSYPLRGVMSYKQSLIEKLEKR
ncbi:MAG: DUF6340 family protein [Bacteroidales bacterium]|jgi:hypothetical protein|nr:DUF6340 family protein [Bacteroidales bacterium]